jgi:hypothetical protein
MIKKIIPVVIVLFSFFIFMELIPFISPERNVMNVNDAGYSYLDNNNNNNVYFLGDSYAATNYVNEGYPIIFRDYFNKRGWNFIDLSVPGSTIVQHKPILDSISNLNPKLIIYFYHISNAVRLSKELNAFKEDYDPNQISNMISDSLKIKKSNKNSVLKGLYDNSATALFLKKTVQYFSLQFNDEFYPGTAAYKYPKETLKHKNELELYFESIQAENVHILVNAQFSAGDKVKQWEHYKVFKGFEDNKEFKIRQAVDIVSDSDYAVSWRNGHPNQEAIKIIADTLMKDFDKIK